MSLAGVVGARVHLGRVVRVRREMGDVRPSVIRALPPEARLSRLARSAGASGWLASLVEDLEREESADARATLIDEAVRDVERTVDGGAVWPAAAARIAAFGGLAAGVGAYLAGSFLAALSAAALGVAGAGLTIGLDRRARESAAECRRAVDDLIDALAAGPAPEEQALASSRVGRPRARRRRFT